MDKLTGSASPRAVSVHALLRRREAEESECVCIDEGQDTYLPQIAGAAIARFFLFFFFFNVAPFIVFRGSAVRRLNQMQNHPIH